MSSSYGEGSEQDPLIGAPGSAGYDPAAVDPGMAGQPGYQPGYGASEGYGQGASAPGYTEGAYAIPSGGYDSAGGASAAYGSTYDSQGGATAATADRPDVEDASVGSLVGKLTSDLSKLMRQEVDLAKAELREEAKKAGAAAGMLAGAGVAGLLFLVFLSITLMWLLDKAMDLWIAALIVTLLWGAAAAVMGLMGKKKLSDVNPKPEQTIETLKEDKEWVQAQRN